jgi:hypothetical protein
VLSTVSYSSATGITSELIFNLLYSLLPIRITNSNNQEVNLKNQEVKFYKSGYNALPCTKQVFEQTHQNFAFYKSGQWSLVKKKKLLRIFLLSIRTCGSECMQARQCHLMQEGHTCECLRSCFLCGREVHAWPAGGRCGAARPLCGQAERTRRCMMHAG